MYRENTGKYKRGNRKIYREGTGEYLMRKQENIQEGNRRINREETGEYTG